MVVNPKHKIRKLASLPPEMWEQIADYQKKQGLKAESEALRKIIEAGLKTLARRK